MDLTLEIIWIILPLIIMGGIAVFVVMRMKQKFEPLMTEVTRFLGKKHT